MEENGKLVSFIYTDREVIAEEDEAGEHIRYIRGHELLASDSAHARTYYHYACDEMGSITDITDCDGTVLNQYVYDAFGNRTVEEETVENRFGFAGEMRDAVTGQYYLRARFYNPVIARFLSEDTYYGDGLNLYAYCHNNPVGYVDPSGHLCEKKQYKLEQYKEYLKQGIDKKEAYQKANYDAIKKYNGLEAAERYRKSHQNTNPVYEQNQKKSNGAGSDSKSGRDSQVSYSRPSGFRKGVRDKVWDNAKNANGDVIDLVTKRVMDKSEPWDMGHKPGYEFRKHQQSAENRGISRKQFLDEYNNPEHYRPELPSSNRSHKGEDITNNYFGD